MSFITRRAPASTAMARARAADPPPLVLADMRAHMGFRPDVSLRAAMAQGGRGVVADKITPERALLQRVLRQATAVQA